MAARQRRKQKEQGVMPQIIEQKVNIGQDAYGRPVSAIRRRTYDGKVVWDIVSDPINQRDDGEKMSGLTDTNIRDLIRALDLFRA